MSGAGFKNEGVVVGKKASTSNSDANTFTIIGKTDETLVAVDEVGVETPLTQSLYDAYLLGGTITLDGVNDFVIEGATGSPFTIDAVSGEVTIGSPGGPEGYGYGYGEEGASTGSLILYGDFYCDDDAVFAEDILIGGRLIGNVGYTPTYPTFYDFAGFFSGMDLSANPTNVTQALDSLSYQSAVAFQTARNLSSSTMLSGGSLSVKNSTEITIAAGNGFIIDHENLLGPFGGAAAGKVVSWNQQDVVIAAVATNDYSLIAIDENGNVIQSITPFSPEEHRAYLVLGKVIHRAGTVDFTIDLQHRAVDVHSQYVDLAEAIGPINLEGNVIEPHDPSSTLEIKKSAGSTFRLNYNSVTDITNPHVTTEALQDPATFFRVYRNGSGDWTYVSSQTTVDPDNYDDGSGTLASVPNNKFSLQRIYMFAGSGRIYVFYGQNTYSTLDEAVIGIDTEQWEGPPGNFFDASFRAYLIIKQGIADLSDPTEFRFLAGGRFQGVEGAGGSGGGAISTFTDGDFAVYYDSEPNRTFSFDLSNLSATSNEIIMAANASQAADITVTLPSTTGTLITGTGVATRVPYYSGADSFTNSANFYYTTGTGLTIADTTASTSSSTGALVVSGGAGIGEDLYVGSQLSINPTSTKAWTANETAIELGRSSAISAYKSGAGDERIGFFNNAYNDGGWKRYETGEAANFLMSNGQLSFQTAPSGAADAAILWTEALNVSSTEFALKSGVVMTLANTTASTSATTGALTVAGGVGIAGDAYINNHFIINSSSIHISDIGTNSSSDAGVHIDGSNQNGAGTTGGIVLTQQNVGDRRLYFTGNNGGYSFNFGSYSTNNGDFQMSDGQVAVAAEFRLGKAGQRVMRSTDENMSLVINTDTDPGAFAATADTDGYDTYIYSQSGGAHTLNNPRGGDIIVTPGVAGSGGAGRDGIFKVEGAVDITGKLTVGGLIDPTGLELTPQASNPGGITTNTLWINSSDSNKLYFGSSEVGGGGSSIADGTVNDATLRWSGTAWVEETSFKIDTNGFAETGAITMVAQAGNPGGTTTLYANSLSSNRLFYGTTSVIVSTDLTPNSSSDAMLRGNGSSWVQENSATLDTSGNIGLRSLTLNNTVISGGTDSPDTIAAGSGGIYYDNSENKWKINENGAGWGDLVSIADGTSANSVLRWDGSAWVEDNGVTIDNASNLTVVATATFDFAHVVATTDSSSTTTGALIVDGGVGIAKKLYANSDHSYFSNVYMNNDTSIRFRDSANTTYLNAMHCDDSDVLWLGRNFTDVYLSNNPASVSAEYNTTRFKVNLTTDSTSPSTGALVVAGGAGFEKNLYVGGFVSSVSSIETVTATGTLSRQSKKKVIVTTSSITVSLWTTGITNGDDVYIRNKSGGNITVDTAGAETIEGNATYTMIDGEARLFTYYATGTDWTLF